MEGVGELPLVGDVRGTAANRVQGRAEGEKMSMVVIESPNESTAPGIEGPFIRGGLKIDTDGVDQPAAHPEIPAPAINFGILDEPGVRRGLHW